MLETSKTPVVTSTILRKSRVRDQQMTALKIWQENYKPKTRLRIVLGTFKK